MKYTVTKLVDIRDKRDASRNNFNKLDKKLRENCTHPKRFMVTASSYRSDTLGTNGYTTYHDECNLCGKWFESYDDSHRPNYPEKKK